MVASGSIQKPSLGNCEDGLRGIRRFRSIVREPLCEGCMNRSDCEDEKRCVACLVAEAECSS